MKRLSESVWTDIHRRSKGAQERKEDDINLMDPDKFFDYLRVNLYKPTTPTYDIKLYTFPFDAIVVPISINGMYIGGSYTYVKLEGFDDPKGMVVTLDQRSLDRLPDDAYTQLKDKYSVKYMSETLERRAYIKIYPKDGSPVTNTFFIEVVDFLLDNIRHSFNPLVKKI